MGIRRTREFWQRPVIVHCNCPARFVIKMLEYFKSIPTHMDFDGQARAENLSRIIVVLFGVVGLIWGYIIQQFSQTVYILGAGLVLATILTVPPWPLYRLKPLKWQKARDLDSSDTKQNAKKKKSTPSHPSH